MTEPQPRRGRATALVLAAAGVSWAACSGGTRTLPPPPAPAPIAERAGDSVPQPVVVVRDQPPPASRTPWTDSLMGAIPLRAKVAQLVVVTIDDADAPAAAESLSAGLGSEAIGGIFIRAGTSAGIRALIESHRRAAAVPLLVGANLEGGPTALASPDLMSLPGVHGIAATRDTILACNAGAAIARQAVAIGIDWSVSLDSIVPPAPDTGFRVPVRSLPERAVDRFVRCQEAAGIVVSSRWADTTGRSDRPRGARLHFVRPAAVAHALDSLTAAIDSGRLSLADEDVATVLRAKERLGLDRALASDGSPTSADVPDSLALDSLAAVVARQSIVLARDRGNAIWRLTRAQRVAVIVHDSRPRLTGDTATPGAAFVDELRATLRRRKVRLDAITVGARPKGTTPSGAIARARAADAVVLALYPSATGAPTATARDLARRLLDEKPNAIVVSMGDVPFAPALPTLRTLLLAWNGRSTFSERAAARAVAGARDRDSTMVARLADTVRAVMARYQSDSAFPGAQAMIGSHDRVLASVGVGRVDWAPSAEPADSTIWDVASLTKVVGMTTAVMQLVGEGRVDLDAPAQRYIPRFRGPGKRRVTVRHLLTHASGLPAWRPLHKEGVGVESALRLVYLTPLDTVPNARMVYSDLGAILLGQVVDKVAKERLDAYLRRRVWRPLRMTDTRFKPDAALLARIAPTEYDPWRQRMIWGVVHDQNAYALGGVSGHAGLFSSARDLAKFARMYLNFGTLDGRRILEPRVIYDFTRVQDSTLSNRALGWEKPTGSNSAGRRMSPAAFGHTGFTGTSLWIDPANDIFVVLLTNRVNPTRQNNRFGEVRIAVADAALAVLGTVRQGTPPLTPRF